MRELARQVLGEPFAFADAGAGSLAEALRAATEVVLLWPDATGYGWMPVEREVFRWKRSGARVFVLNGRRRHFELTWRSLPSYWLRRALERLWVGELVFTAGFILLSPGLVVWDWVKGRR